MRKQFAETLQLLPLLPKRPQEFYYRLMVRFERRREKAKPIPYAYQPESFEAMLDKLGQRLRRDVRAILQEAPLQEIESAVDTGIQRLPDNIPFPRVHNSDHTFGKTLYLLCRLLQPEHVVETGVAFGVSSSYVLQSLAVNGKGTLHSIDLPASLQPEAARFVGALIPTELRGRWQLHSGVSRYVMPPLLKKLGRVDLFIHDSSHTYENMRWEFATAAPYLAPSAALVSDDVERNAAFGLWAEAQNPSFWSVVQEANKKTWFGVSLRWSP